MRKYGDPTDTARKFVEQVKLAEREAAQGRADSTESRRARKEAAEQYTRLIESLDPPDQDPSHPDPAPKPIDHAVARELRDARRQYLVLLRQTARERPVDYEMAFRVFEDSIRVFDDATDVRERLFDLSQLIRAMGQAGDTRAELLPLLQRTLSTYDLADAYTSSGVWAAIFEALAVDRPNAALLSSALELYDRTGAVASGREAEQLLAAYANVGDWRSAEALSRTLETVTPRGRIAMLRAALAAPVDQREAAIERARTDVLALEGPLGTAAWNLLIQADAAASRRPALPPIDAPDHAPSTELAVLPIDQMRSSGVVADDETVAALVAADDARLETLDDALELLDRAETASGTQVGEQALAVCITRLAETVPVAEKGVDDHPAMQLYRALVHGPRAIAPSSMLIEPLLRQVALVPDEQGWVDLGPARSLYLDVSSAHENGLSAPPTVDVYTSLMRACALQPTSAGIAFALGLVEDMTSYARRLPDVEMAALAADVMQTASERDDAFKLWEVVVKQYDDGRLMQRPAFDRLLRGYLNVPSTQLAPLKNMHTVIRTMRRAGEPPGFTTYRALILHYARHDQSDLAEGASLRPLGEIPPGNVKALRQIHSILSIDPFYDPSIHLLNALIQAYSHAGAYDDAWRLWQSILLAPQRCDWDHKTVTNVLDLCSFARRFEPARVWYAARMREADEQKRAGGFALDKHAWDTWVECLARLGSPGQLDLAIDVVFGQMSGRPNIFQEPVEVQAEAQLRTDETKPPRDDWVPAPQPDERTLGPLIKFAHARGGRELFDWVRARIQADLPQLWERVEHIGTLDWAQVREERWLSGWPDEIDHDEPWSKRAAS